MIIYDIYKKFDIPKNLIEHLLRVSSISKYITKNDYYSVSSALLHDLGNFAKFDLSDITKAPWCKDENELNIYREKQKEFWKKYNKNPDKATIIMLNEICADKNVISILKEIFEFDFLSTYDLSVYAKVVIYSDMRVSPNGITTLKERNEESRKRYASNPNSTFSEKDFDKFEKIGNILEKELLELFDFELENITEDLYKKQKDELLKFDIKTC